MHMVRDTDATVKEIRQVRFPGLLANAHALGVSRNHLYLVLTGKRQSDRLLTQLASLHGGRLPYEVGDRGRWS